MDDTRPARRAAYAVDRLSALSDGVFAIVLTLLVLELKLPEAHPTGSILTTLGENAHDFLAWAISFVAIARFWMVHHAVTASMRRCHTGTLALNFVVLGAVTLMPFTAAAIGNYDLVEPWSTVLFALNLGGVSLGLGFMARHASTKEGLLHPDRPPESLHWHRRHHLYVLPGVTVAAGLLAFVEPYVAIALLAGEFIWVAVGGLRQPPKPG